jgi:acetyl esterase/lipase
MIRSNCAGRPEQPSTGYLLVLVADYRLAPEHVYLAAVEDAITAYQWLLAQDIPAQKFVVAGEAAVGGLSVALLVKLKRPACRNRKRVSCFPPGRI